MQPQARISCWLIFASLIPLSAGAQTTTTLNAVVEKSNAGDCREARKANQALREQKLIPADQAAQASHDDMQSAYELKEWTPFLEASDANRSTTASLTAQQRETLDFEYADTLMLKGSMEQSRARMQRFLADHPDTPKLARAKYGIAIALFHVGRRSVFDGEDMVRVGKPGLKASATEKGIQALRQFRKEAEAALADRALALSPEDRASLEESVLESWCLSGDGAELDAKSANWPPARKEAVAFSKAHALFDFRDWDRARTALEAFIAQYPDAVDISRAKTMCAGVLLGRGEDSFRRAAELKSPADRAHALILRNGGVAFHEQYRAEALSLLSDPKVAPIDRSRIKGNIRSSLVLLQSLASQYSQELKKLTAPADLQFAQTLACQTSAMIDQLKWSGSFRSEDK